MAYAREHDREVVFRAAAPRSTARRRARTILVDVGRHRVGIEVLDEDRRARVAPGTTILRANTTLARHGRVLGPDPASAIACTVGGVVANNASGMTAGTTRRACTWPGCVPSARRRPRSRA
nr:FAD-binding protein [Streptomyces sp. CNQ431]